MTIQPDCSSLWALSAYRDGGGALFAAYVVATVPLLVLVGLTMKQFVTGLTSGTGLT